MAGSRFNADVACLRVCGGLFEYSSSHPMAEFFHNNGIYDRRVEAPTGEEYAE